MHQENNNNRKYTIMKVRNLPTDVLQEIVEKNGITITKEAALAEIERRQERTLAPFKRIENKIFIDDRADGQLRIVKTSSYEKKELGVPFELITMNRYIENDMSGGSLTRTIDVCDDRMLDYYFDSMLETDENTWNMWVRKFEKVHQVLTETMTID